MALTITDFTPRHGPSGTWITLQVVGLPATELGTIISVCMGDIPLESVERASRGVIRGRIGEHHPSGPIAVMAMGSNGKLEAAQTAQPFTVEPSAGAPLFTHVSPVRVLAGARQIVEVRGRGLDLVDHLRLGPTVWYMLPGFTRSGDSCLLFRVPSNIAPGAYRIYGYTADARAPCCPQPITIVAAG